MIPEYLKNHLVHLAEEDLERNQEHLAWLASPEANEEEDKDLQFAETTKMIQLNREALEYLR